MLTRIMNQWRHPVDAHPWLRASAFNWSAIPVPTPPPAARPLWLRGLLPDARRGQLAVAKWKIRSALPASTFCRLSASMPAVNSGISLSELGQRVTLWG